MIKNGQHICADRFFVLQSKTFQSKNAEATLLQYISLHTLNDHLTLLFPKRNAVSPDSFNPVSPEYRGIISRLNLLHGSVAHRVKFLIILYVLDFDHKADLAVLTLDNHVASTLARFYIA